MDDKAVYNGIEIYSGKDNKATQVTFLSMLFILMLVIAFYFGIKMFKNININNDFLTTSEIEYFIDIADEVSSGKAQVNWQQVAAISEAYCEGNLALVNDNDSRTISESFLIDNGDGTYGILSMEQAMDKLNLSSRAKDSALKYLEKVAGSSLYEGLYTESDKINFINSIEGQAEENYNSYGILPSITMAQAILESGWGTSELASQHNNLFGIKADERRDCAVATMTTKENYSDVIEANFRKYDSALDSIKDHGLFLASNERYTVNGVFTAKDYKAQALALQNAGYSTAKDEAGNLIYAQKLINVVQNYNLMLYDSKVKTE